MDRRRTEQAVLDVVTTLVTELGALPPGASAALDDSLDRDLGLGSLERVELRLRVEQALGVGLADNVAAEADTPRALVDAVLIGRPAVVEPLTPPVLARSAGPGPPPSADTLVDVLAWHAETEPRRAHVVLRAEDGLEHEITFEALWHEARQVASALREEGVAAGDRVATMLRTEPAFFPVFFGILVAGGIPVPIYPPVRLDRLEEYAARQVGILANAEASVLVTFTEARRVAGLLQSRLPALRRVVTATQARGGREAEPAAVHRHSAALIQYTSGSTGDPKGVVLTHANLLANIRALGEALAVRPDDVLVSWLPLYHDMGLIGCWLGGLYHGVPVVIMAPSTFLARPVRWLAALHAHRGTISPAPNFAFDLCASKIRDDEIHGLDLGAWRLALNGSEPVSAETIERFTRRFAAFGFRPDAMCPVYGLAESAVGLTCPPPGRGPRIDSVRRATFERTRQAEPSPAAEPAALRFVSCGRPLPGHDVRIVDATGVPVAERVEGRIEFRGPSVTRGYFRQPALTQRAVRHGWMDSGDLGYWADGELYVTGRQKDVIIKAGRNLYPQEIEEVTGQVPGIRKGCVAAFGVSDPAIGTERLVVIAESRQRDTAARARLREAVADRVVTALGLPADTVVIADPGAVLKTPSGKVRRSATRQAYVAGTLGHRRSARRQWLGLLAGSVILRVRGIAATAARLGYGLRVGLLLAVAFPSVWIAALVLPAGRPLDRAVRQWSRAVLALAGCRLDVRGTEHLPPPPCVLAANHGSYLDAVALFAAIPADFRFVAKRELLRAPIVGRVIRRVGHLPVERMDLARSVADAAGVGRALRAGISLFFFPEGTFVQAPGLLPFRLGTFKAAVDAGSPVVPVAIRGTREILPAGAWLPRRGAITVTVKPALHADEPGWRGIVGLRDRTRAAIGEELAEAQAAGI